MTYNSEDFLNLVPGEIGKISYYKKVVIEIDPNKKDSQIDMLSGRYISMLISNACYGNSPDLSNVYKFSRDNSRKDLAEINTKFIIVNIPYQIGNEECHKELLNIESSEFFVNWADYDLIESIKEQHNKKQNDK